MKCAIFDEFIKLFIKNASLKNGRNKIVFMLRHFAPWVERDSSGDPRVNTNGDPRATLVVF